MQPDPFALGKSKTAWLVLGLAVAATLAGFFAGRHTHPDTAAKEANPGPLARPPSLTSPPVSPSGAASTGPSTVGLSPSLTSSNAVKSTVRRALSLLRDGLMNPRDAAAAIDLIRSLSQEQTGEALDIAIRLPEGQNRNLLIAGILGRLAEFDPHAALQFLETEGGKYRTNIGAEAINGIVASWLATDPKGAWDWFFSEAPSVTLQGNRFQPAAAAARPLFESLASSNLDAAIAHLQRLEGSNLYGRALDGVIQGALRADAHSSALEAVGQIGDANSRTFAQVRILEDWAALDPPAASSWYDSQQPLDPQGNIRNGLATSWMAEDPYTAAEWWWDHTPDDQRAASLKRMVGVWALRDPSGAGDWLRSFDPGPELDSAVAALVDSAVRGHPQEALEWTQAITNADLRLHVYESAVRIWAGLHPQEAYDHVSQSQELPASRRDQLLLSITPPGLAQ